MASEKRVIAMHRYKLLACFTKQTASRAVTARVAAREVATVLTSVRVSPTTHSKVPKKFRMADPTISHGTHDHSYLHVHSHDLCASHELCALHDLCASHELCALQWGLHEGCGRQVQVCAFRGVGRLCASHEDARALHADALHDEAAVREVNASHRFEGLPVSRKVQSTA